MSDASMVAEIARRFRSTVLRVRGFVRSETREPPTCSSELSKQENADAEYVRRSIERGVRRARAARLRQEALDDLSNSLAENCANERPREPAKDLRRHSAGATGANQPSSPDEVGTDFKPRQRMSL